jgi:FtsP/CotA-like multicopper oxidase with cupredoxin domain
LQAKVTDGLARPVLTDAVEDQRGVQTTCHQTTVVDFQGPFDQSELWRFHTNGNAPHPVHVHGASFQVISRSGGSGALFPWEAGWKDTVLLEDGESVEVLIRFTAYRGLYLMHCHKLEHEDMGMMSNFEVI